MRVILSKNVPDIFNQFVVVDSFKKVKELEGVDTLIIHTFVESDFDAGVFIPEFRKNGVNCFVYINNNPSTTLRMIISGLKGHFFDDEFYLESEEELLCLLDDIKDMHQDNEGAETTSLAVPSLNVVSDFIQSFARGEERIKAPLYLEQVRGAINELSVITHQQELQINAMGCSAIDVFEKASTIIKSMDTQRKIIEKQLAELEATATTSTNRSVLGNGVFFFPPFRYIGTSKVLLIRELSPCRFLTSFVYGYVHYLHFILNKRVKLIFIHQKGAGVAQKYMECTSITQDSVNVSSLYDADVVATNTPKKEVMRDLLGKQEDIFVVVDRLYGSQDIVTGKVIKVNAISGYSDVNRYKLKIGDCIFSTTGFKGELFHIPLIKGFPTDRDARLASYKQVNEASYKLLDERLQLK